MNEAEPSNHGAFIESLNSANSPQVEQASCPFYSVVPNENMAIRQLPLLGPAKDEQPKTQVPDMPTGTTKQEWVAEPDLDKQALVDSEFQKLLTLNEELRFANNGLYEQIEKLENDLDASDKVIQWQKRRTSVTESMLNQQTQELTAAQEQIKSLFQQLETAVQNVQRQEICIETYKAQLQISQQRLAQLERECSLLQTNYSEQSQQLLQSENSCRELRTRLMRQQRQTLQFKAALEKCLETPVPGDDSLEDGTTPKREKNTKQSRFAKKARSLFPNAQPIKPWSAVPESLTDNLDSSQRESSGAAQYHSSESPAISKSPWDWSEKEEQPTPTQADTYLDSSHIIDDSLPTPEVVSSLPSPNIDEQIESLMQMFFISQPASPSSLSNMDKDLDSNQADVSFWETSATTIPDDEPAETVPETNPPISWVVNNASASTNNSPVSPNAAKSLDSPLCVHAQTTVTAENEDYWLEISPLNQPDSPLPNVGQDLSEDSTTDDKSPSPVVYPQRPPKGRKSLASVELPNFRHQSQ
jgi:myosin heavy subunit